MSSRADLEIRKRVAMCASEDSKDTGAFGDTLKSWNGRGSGIDWVGGDRDLRNFIGPPYKVVVAYGSELI